jgi:lysozyme
MAAKTKTPPVSLSTRARGCDISAYQQFDDPARWFANARSGGLSFCFIKSTEGNGSRSRLYASRKAAAAEAGVKAGPYHFAHPEAVQGDAVREAALSHEVSGRWASGDLPPVLDLEQAPAGMSADALAEWGLTFLAEVHRLSGRTPMLYTNPWFWRTRLAPAKRSAEFGRYGLWVSQYPNESKVEWPTDRYRPTALYPWNSGATDVETWAFWQFSGRGIVPWHRGPVDLDVFNGTEQDLDRFCR